MVVSNEDDRYRRDFEPERTRFTPFWDWLADGLIFLVDKFEKALKRKPPNDP